MFFQYSRVNHRVWRQIALIYLSHLSSHIKVTQLLFINYYLQFKYEKTVTTVCGSHDYEPQRLGTEPARDGYSLWR